MGLLHAGRLGAGLDSLIEAKTVIVWLDASMKARGSDACWGVASPRPLLSAPKLFAKNG